MRTLTDMRFLLVVFGLLLFSFPSYARAPNLLTKEVGDGFGVQIKGWLVDEAELVRIRATGFGFVRFAVGWDEIEKTRGVYNWTETDDLVRRVRKAGLKMVVPLLGGHAFYDGAVPAPWPNTDHVRTRTRAPSSPESVEAFARFASAAVSRYGADDIVWEIWNEPDLARFWPPRPNVDVFSVLAERTCKAMRALVPGAVIVGPALGRVPDPRDGVSAAYWDAFLSSGASACLNAFSVHPYRHGDEKPEAAFQDYRRLFLLMATRRRQEPLLNTEWGYSTAQLSEDKQADYILRARLMDILWGLPLSVWYEWRDSCDDASDLECRFGVTREDGSGKAALSVVQDILPRLRHAVLDKAVPSADPRDMVFLLRDGDRKILMGWSLREKNFPDLVFEEEGERKSRRLSSRPQILASSPSVKTVSLNGP
jgi:polysaccharide biosynthesis protein PslG